MADTKLTDLVGTTPTADDVLYIVDDPAAGKAPRKATVSALMSLAPVQSVAALTGVVTAAGLRTAINVENGATADQTGAEIKALYEAEADTNAYTDAEKTKLAGIASGAQVNTVTSVNAATGVIVLDADDIDDTSTTHKFATAAQLSKLDGVESGATADQTGSEIVAAIDTQLGSSTWQSGGGSMSGADIVTAVDTELGSTVWQSGGAGGSWGSITGTLSSQTDLQAALDAKQASGSYAAATHSHAITDTTGLQAALDAKQAVGSYANATHSHIISDTTGLQTALDGKAASSHTHAISDVTNLQTTLDGKQASGSYAAATHTHIIADTTGLQTALDAKAASSHTHPLSGLEQSGATLNQVPKWNGSAWTPQDEAGAGGGIGNVVEDTTPQLGGQLDVNGQSFGDGTRELLKFVETALAVNEVTVTNAATGSGPTLSATGDDTNIDLNLAGKGTGTVKIGTYAVLTENSGAVLSAKTTPVGADDLLLFDSAASDEPKTAPVTFFTNEVICVAASDETTALTTGTSKVTFRMPWAMTLTAVRASVSTAPVGSTIIVDINENGTTILSTKLSIDASEKTSTTAATAAVISDTALANDSEITIDIDQVGSGTAGAGLKVYLIGYR